MKKEGSEENQEEKHTIRQKEAKSNLEEGGKSINNQQNVGSTAEQGDH